jgi:hypothetical protein
MKIALTKGSLSHFPDNRNRGYRSRRSPGEQLQIIRDILSQQCRLREQMGRHDIWLSDFVDYIDRGCIPQ